MAEGLGGRGSVGERGSCGWKGRGWHAELCDTRVVNRAGGRGRGD